MAYLDKKFDSNSQEWETPNDLFKFIDSKFHFTIDLAASKENKKCDVFFSSDNTAMDKEWVGVCWLNPPYGNKDTTLKDWIKKSYNESRKDNCIVVMLIPSRTNTSWWHEYILKSSEILFIKGRPKFNKSQHGLPQPLSVVVFSGKSTKPTFSSIDINNLHFQVTPTIKIQNTCTL